MILLGCAGTRLPAGLAATVNRQGFHVLFLPFHSVVRTTTCIPSKILRTNPSIGDCVSAPSERRINNGEPMSTSFLMTRLGEEIRETPPLRRHAKWARIGAAGNRPRLSPFPLLGWPGSVMICCSNPPVATRTSR